MKRLKLMTACIAILVFSNLLFAENPLSVEANNIAGIMTDKLGRDIILTDSQKVIIQQKATAFIVKMQNANSTSSAEDKFTLKKQASDEYEVTLDSLLTPEQRNQIRLKSKERQDAIINQYQSKK